ncbi:hypothetical protein HJG60_008156 [Phyllostomus discolor]|uniref:Uncharacterized protein n=1 Tax=Phyllostomus discolor TaxID=89673 RepID=A0A834DLW1_9CHIR|nr:hypothetical protein HJG60_008156 [Phyllostomus discolor]
MPGTRWAQGPGRPGHTRRQRTAAPRQCDSSADTPSVLPQTFQRAVSSQLERAESTGNAHISPALSTLRFPAIDTPYAASGTFVTIREPAWTHHCHPESAGDFRGHSAGRAFILWVWTNTK